MTRKLRYIFPGCILKLLYDSLIQPYINYYSIVWMITFPSLLKPLSLLREKTSQLVSNANTTSTNSLLRFRPQYILSCTIFVHKYLHGQLSSCFSKFLRPPASVKLHGTRNSEVLLVVKIPTMRSDFSPVYA